MKKEIIIVFIILVAIAGTSTFFIFQKGSKKEDTKNNETAWEEVDAEIDVDDEEYYDDDEDIDLESLELDLSEEEIASFNEGFEEYDGKTIDGRQAKELVDLVIETNLKYVGDGKRFISIDDDNYQAVDNKLYMRCLDANPYYLGDNTKENVDNAIEQMNSFKDLLEDEASYEVTLIKGRGLLVEIKIAKE